MARRIMHSVLAGIVVSVVSLPSIAKPMPDDSLKVVIIRHGEKPETGFPPMPDHLEAQVAELTMQTIRIVLFIICVIV